MSLWQGLLPPREDAEAEAQGGDDGRPSQLEAAAAAKPGVMVLFPGFLSPTSSHVWTAQGSQKASLPLDFLLLSCRFLSNVRICLFLAWNFHLESFNAKLLPLTRSPSWASEE